MSSGRKAAVTAGLLAVVAILVVGGLWGRELTAGASRMLANAGLMGRPGAPRITIEKSFPVVGSTGLAWSPDGKLLAISNEPDRRNEGVVVQDRERSREGACICSEKTALDLVNRILSSAPDMLSANEELQELAIQRCKICHPQELESSPFFVRRVQVESIYMQYRFTNRRVNVSLGFRLADGVIIKELASARLRKTTDDAEW